MPVYLNKVHNTFFSKCVSQEGARCFIGYNNKVHHIRAPPRPWTKPCSPPLFYSWNILGTPNCLKFLEVRSMSDSRKLSTHCCIWLFRWVCTNCAPILAGFCTCVYIDTTVSTYYYTQVYAELIKESALYHTRSFSCTTLRVISSISSVASNHPYPMN